MSDNVILPKLFVVGSGLAAHVNVGVVAYALGPVITDMVDPMKIGMASKEIIFLNIFVLKLSERIPITPQIRVNEMGYMFGLIVQNTGLIVQNTLIVQAIRLQIPYLRCG